MPLPKPITTNPIKSLQIGWMPLMAFAATLVNDLHVAPVAFEWASAYRSEESVCVCVTVSRGCSSGSGERAEEAWN